LVLAKIAPDLADEDARAVANLVLEMGLAGVIATNTTISTRGPRQPEKPC
jgi:dihydroorotate dehydrogenase